MSRRILTLAVVAGAMSTAPAQAATLTVQSKSIGCCAASQARGIAWTVERPAPDPTPGSPAPATTVSRVTITKDADANTMLFFRAATTGALVDSVVYETSVLRTCLRGARLVKLETEDTGDERLTFAFTTMSIQVPALKAGFTWDVTRQSGANIAC